MTNNFAKCGCDCINCPTYKDNLRTNDDRLRCSTGWKSYLNIKLSPEKLRACDGCSIPDSQRHIFYLNCKVRKCAMDNGFDNCAYCKGFPCDELQEMHSLQKIKDLSDFVSKKGIEISEQEYKVFIEPYTGLAHLEKIRQRLSENDIKNYKKYSMRKVFAAIKKNNHKNERLSIIYTLLTSICVEDSLSLARWLTLTAKRKKLMRILWTIGYHGTFNQAAGHIELDGHTFLTQKIISMHKELKKLFDDLVIHDINAEIVPLIEDGWLTPSGGLKKEGWVIRLSFGSSLLGSKTLLTFIEYISALKRKYGLNGFRFFNRGDLGVMIN